MKKIKYFLIAAIIIGAISFSCKKSSGTKTSTTVEYLVTPMNHDIDTLWYRDSSNYDIEITGPSTNQKTSFSVNGSETIQIPSTPFTARLKIAFWHTNTSNPYYDLKILVNGEVKKETTVTNVSIGYSEIDYTIQ